jgi:hypothetical protein
MPIRFACEHCDSTLSVSSRKAGQQVTCPKCRQKTPVPLSSREPVKAAAESRFAVEASPSSPPPIGLDDEPTSPPLTPGPIDLAPPPEPEPEPEAPEPRASYRQHTVTEGDDEVTWVIETTPADSGHYDGGEIDFDRVSLPRYVLYAQGVLLIGVAMFALTFGILIGRSTVPTAIVSKSEPKTCYLTGTVGKRTSGGTIAPERGAVVMVLPERNRPSDKAPVEGLRPDDPLPSPDQPALSRIKAIGGDYTRTDEEGNFKLRVPDVGDYFLLVISSSAARKPTDRLETLHLAQIGRYVTNSAELLGDRQYRLRSEVVKKDKEYKFEFE